MRRAYPLCLLALLLASTPLLAEDGLPAAKTKTVTLAAFKNGLGFVYRSGETSLKDGWAVLEELPSASLGALWIGTASPVVRVTEVIACKGKVTREVDPVNLSELLAANIGRRAVVTYAVGSASTPQSVDGTIVYVASDRRPDEPGAAPQPYYQAEAARGQVVLIRAEGGGTLAVNKPAIVAVMFLDDGAQVKAKLDRDVTTARVHVEKASKNADRAEITLSYLEKGINWTPSYLVNIADEKQAELTLEAVLSNDVEDLDDVDVSFVAGYPHFLYADLFSPLLTQQSVAQFVQGMLSGRPQSSYADRASAMAQNVAYYGYDRDSRSSAGVYTTNQPMPGESNEDLYFYHQPHVTLKKGDRARYTVFTVKAPYEHIYQWEIPDSANLDDTGYRRSSSSNASSEQPDQVWHALRLENTSTQPWTTAAALTVNGSMPVAQDMLKYTPPKGKNTLKLTVATDVRAEQSQTEASREVVKIGYNEYDRIAVDGKLTVKNFKSKAIRADVRKSLTGEVLEAGQDGKVSKVVKKVTAVNPQSEIEWDFSLSPGESKELTYKYSVLVRR